MAEEELDQIHEMKERIWDAVHEIVDSMTKHLSDDADELVRLQLTEQFRFWRRAPRSHT